jgi:hypothetical protein
MGLIPRQYNGGMHHHHHLHISYHDLGELPRDVDILPNSTSTPAPPPDRVCLQALRYVLLLPKIELRLKACASNP